MYNPLVVNGFPYHLATTTVITNLLKILRPIINKYRYRTPLNICEICLLSSKPKNRARLNTVGSITARKHLTSFGFFTNVTFRKQRIKVWSGSYGRREKGILAEENELLSG